MSTPKPGWQKYKQHYTMFVVLVAAIIALQARAQQAYQPKFEKGWAVVKDSILASWHLSKTDPAKTKSRTALALPKTYMSIRPNRNVLFGWDTYFTGEGLLLVDSLAIYAKHAADNQLAEIEQLGFVPNASETWALNRSQTPFTAMLVRAVYNKFPDKTWLDHAYHILKKEYHFWTDTSTTAIEDHSTSVPGLQRFYQHATKNELLSFYGQIASRFGFADSLPEHEKMQLGEAWISEAETGMDFTPRFENRCHQFIAVDLNANLFRYEMDFAWMVKELGLHDEPAWEQMAAKRRQLMIAYCWDKGRGLFMDYDYVNKRFSTVPSIASFYPLWAGLASKEQAVASINNLPLFEFDYGPTICPPFQKQHHYQWDYPAGWPPIYFLVNKALENYGYKADAKRVAAKYLDIVTKNFYTPVPRTFTSRNRGSEVVEQRAPGFVYEKYNVVDGTIHDAEYPSRSFHGWSYGVFIYCLHYLSAH